MVRVVAAATPDGRNHALRREQLASDRMKARHNRLANLADSKKAIKFGCATRLGPEGSHWSYSHHGKACTMSSAGSTTWSTRSSSTPERGWWWFTSTDCHHTWRLLRTSSLKEGEVWRVPNNVNLQSELLWLCKCLVVITNNPNTLLVIAV
jgi:hypothetical protein